MADNLPARVNTPLALLPLKKPKKTRTLYDSGLMPDDGVTGPKHLTHNARTILGSLGEFLSFFEDTRQLPKTLDLYLAPLVDPEIGNEFAYRGLLPHVERMAQQGMDHDFIADRLGIPRGVFKEAMIFLPDFAIALRGGLARGVDEASWNLSMSSRRGDTSATKFILQTRGNYSAPKGNAPSVIVNIGSERATVDLSSIDAMKQRQETLLDDVEYVEI